MALLSWLLAQRLGGLSWAELSSTVLRASLASAVMALPLGWAASHWSGGPAISVGLGGLIVGVVIYAAAAVFLRMPELQLVRRPRN
jgi:peptidoglycan biosynthesis protein MviN/MurJ (putative lipid II flippase)